MVLVLSEQAVQLVEATEQFAHEASQAKQAPLASYVPAGHASTQRAIMLEPLLPLYLRCGDVQFRQPLSFVQLAQLVPKLTAQGVQT
jgi:hypothetical protein